MRPLLFALAFLGAGAPGPVPLPQGEPAPFSGILVSPETAAELVEERAEVDRLRAHLAAERKLRDALEETYEARLRACAEVPWYDQPDVRTWSGFGAGIAVGVGSMMGGAYLSGLAAGANDP